MTREEASFLLANIDRRVCDDELNEALDMAIKALEQESSENWYDVPSYEMTLEQARRAVKDLRKKWVEHLEQEPCADAISRQAVIDVIERWLKCSGYNEAERHIMRAVQSVLYDSPSVNPQEQKMWSLDDAREPSVTSNK